VKIQGVVKSFIVDTGSSISLVKPGLIEDRIRETKVSPYGATGDKLKVEGKVDADFIIANYRFRHKFIVCELPTEAHGFLGIDFLMENDGCLKRGKESSGLGSHRTGLDVLARENFRTNSRSRYYYNHLLLVCRLSPLKSRVRVKTDRAMTMCCHL
jgi:hypothetical protein